MTNILQNEIRKLKNSMLKLVSEVEDNVYLSVTALNDRSIESACKVIDNDLKIDNMEVELEEECLKILALYQPVASDLRYIVAILKINNDLERISDLAVNIAERAKFLIERKPVKIAFDFLGMALEVQTMLRKSITALIKLDIDTAVEVCSSDDIVDNMHRDMYGIVEAAIRNEPSKVQEILQYLSASRQLERIADHATNIAEDVIYMIKGDIMRHNVKDLSGRCQQPDKHS